MRRFTELYRTLDQTTSTNAKVGALVEYFGAAPRADVAWAVYFLSGRRLRRLVGAGELRQWLVECSELPEWLVEQTYASVGDLAETIALLLADRVADDPFAGRRLCDFVEQDLLTLRGLDDGARRARVTGWWQSLPYDACYLVNKLMTGALRVGVSQTLVATALAQVSGLPRPTILHRMMGEWTPDAAFAEALLAADDGAEVLSRPYPYCLASPVERQPGELGVAEIAELLGPREHWHAEWKWDGIRGQLIRRRGEVFLWSRGEELITGQFPEITEAAQALPDGTVLDGELLAWRDGAPLPFSALQRRIGRKKPGRKTLADYPVVLRCYDLLEHGGKDIRALELAERRERLEGLAAAFPERLHVSELLDAPGWDALAALRAESRERAVEGLMLKRRDSHYGTGRQRGTWWKWKIEPHTVDAVMLYAQPGHGRRANLYTDYTFAVWDGDALVPIAKAYSGLDNAEIDELDRWIRRNTRERFGPVRSVEPVQVFELAFEAIARSTRHKSGIAVRFPRIRRWRRELEPGQADSLASLEALLS